MESLSKTSQLPQTQRLNRPHGFSPPQPERPDTQPTVAQDTVHIRKFKKRKADQGASPAGARSAIAGLNDAYLTPKVPETIKKEMAQSQNKSNQRVAKSQATVEQLTQQQAADLAKAQEAMEAAEAMPKGPEKGKAYKYAAKLQKEAEKGLQSQINQATNQAKDADNVLQNIERTGPADPKGLEMSQKQQWFDRGQGQTVAADNLQGHYQKHAAETGASSPSDYLQKAQDFAENPPKGTVQLADQNSPTRVLYEPKSRMIGVYTEVAGEAGKHTPVTYHQLNSQSAQFPDGHRAANHTQAFLESRLEGVDQAPATPVKNSLTTGQKIGKVAQGGLGALGLGLGAVQAVQGASQLAGAKNADEAIQGGGHLGQGLLSSGSGAAVLKGAGAIASKLGGGAAIVDGATDLYQGIKNGDTESTVLGGIKAAAGTAMFFPGAGTAVGGAVLVGAAVYENRDWLAKQAGNGWSALSQLWEPNR